MLAVEAAVTIGQTGAWVGPLLVGLAAAGLDYSAVGSDAWRDRFAVAGYYASAVSFAWLLGLAGWERELVASDYNWRMIGACASLATHGALLLAMFGSMIGPTKVLAASLAARLKFAGTESKAAKINQVLLGWTVSAGITAPLSGDAGWGRIVDGIATATTGTWGALIHMLFRWLGG